MIDLSKNNEIVRKSVKRLQQHESSLPTFAQISDPSLIPEKIKDGFGSHRIGGIGDKQIPWLQNRFGKIDKCIEEMNQKIGQV